MTTISDKLETITYVDEDYYILLNGIKYSPYKVNNTWFLGNNCLSIDEVIEDCSIPIEDQVFFKLKYGSK